MKRTFRDTALFHHTVRLGKGGKPMAITKFRTMKRNAHADNSTQIGKGDPILKFLVADSRITRIGRLLRRTHVDELPQIVGLLSGKLNLVGIRPMPRTEYRSLPQEIKEMYDEMWPGLFGIHYACRPFPPTKEQLFEEFKRFHAMWKKNKRNAYIRYARRIIANRLAGKAPTK